MLAKMDENAFKTNLNTLKEIILDEQRLVTYVSLSKELCIHVNDSKKLLTTVVEDIKKNQPGIDLNVSYVLSGLSEDNKGRTTVSSETEINNLKQAFKIVFYDHIYSVCRGVLSIDNVAFLAVNKFEDIPLCTGLVKSSSCIKRTTAEIGTLKTNSQEVVVTEQKPSNLPIKKTKGDLPKLETKKEDTDLTVKVHETKSEPTIKTEIQSPKKELSTNNTKQKPDNGKTNGKSQKGIAGFFSKSNSVSAKKVLKETAEIKQNLIKENIIKKEEAMDVDIEVPVEKEIIKTEIKKKENEKEAKKSKPVNQIKKNAKVDKKRKRVLHVSDSESDDEKNDPFIEEPEPAPESDDEIPPTPMVHTVKITSGIVNPKKRRKIVDKTYTDEEGYILTKKEEVYESCSDSEEVTIKENLQVKPNHIKVEISPKGKKNEPKNSKKKISPPQKGKQATLMNFFKKV